MTITTTLTCLACNGAGHGDAVANEAALFDGGIILSMYQVGPERIWIMTAADRSETTIMLPYEFAKKRKGE